MKLAPSNRWGGRLLRIGLALVGAVVALSPLHAAGNQEKDAVKQVVAAVQSGENLTERFPGAVSEREVQSLQRVATCKAFNLMRQPKGYWTVVWGCKDGGMLGMEVHFKDGTVSQVSTMEVYRRPNVESR